MKEIRDIIKVFEAAAEAGKNCALATVVHVEGSSYRRPGARMLVMEDGKLTGAISGGCLEGDALRKALLAISEGCNKLVTYDTTDEDDAKLGVQLGCNGIVHILFEPIINTSNDGARSSTGKLDNPVSLLKRTVLKRENAVLATLFSLEDKTSQPGTCYVSNEAGNDGCTGSFKHLGESLKSTVMEDAAVALANKNAAIAHYEEGGTAYSALLQFLPPPVSLIIVGAGNDALPLEAIANILGWEITIVDGRYTHATKQRFRYAKNIIIAKAENVLQTIQFDQTTVCVLMTHNYNYDLAVLMQLLQKNLPYIGVLGPRSKRQRMYNDLEKKGIMVTEGQKEKIYSPVGLDIGAETSEEIALSIAAGIKAALMDKDARPLRNKEVPIHK